MTAWRCSLLIGVTQTSLADEVNVFTIDDVIIILILLQRLQFIDLFYWSTLSLQLWAKEHLFFYSVFGEDK